MKISSRGTLAFLILLWLAISWAGSGWYADRKTADLLAEETVSLESESLALFQAFEERLAYLSSLPALIGRLPLVMKAVERYSHPGAIRQAEPDPMTYWSTRPDLEDLNTRLLQLANELRVDVIFVLNAEGYCIAASNSNTPGSIVGTLLTDRHYYQAAIAGENAHQYAVGRKTNVPGLFYSAPIMLGKEAHGVLVVKLDIPNFQGLLAPYHAFLTDNHDVIVLSSLPDLLQHKLAGARFDRLSNAERQFQYKRSEYPTLNLAPWSPNASELLHRLNDIPQPVLVTERNIPGGDLVMHVYQTLPEIATIQRERLVFAVISALAGLSTLGLIYQLVLYLIRLRQSKTHAEAESERLHASLSEREQQLETILEHLPLMVVARNPATGAVLSSNPATQNVLGLPEPLTAEQSYEKSLSPELAHFLTATDKLAAYAHDGDTPRELQLSDKVLLAQTVAARDLSGQPRLLIDLVEDITQRRRNEDEIRRLAFVDTLTGLNNRTAFKRHLDATVTQAVSNGVYGSMILVDLDAFKQINDRFGHSLGDELLRELAHRLAAEASNEVFLARLASDEFVIVIDSRSTTREDAAHTATRIANALFRRITQPYLLEHHTLHVTASLGVALFGPGRADTSDLLLIQTDAAMYEAKRRQRGTIQFFDENTQKYLNDQADMANRLRGALSQNDFHQYYQPQVNHAGRVVGVEALLRWHDPKLGDISPSAFIPLAESLHLIVDIDRWVLRQACRVAGTWRKDPLLGKVAISINVSAEFFSLDEFIDEVTGYLTQFGADPTQIMIELTEGTVVEDTEANILKIRALHDAGLSIAIDDFGTGNSSLAYLRLFDVDQIKIDQRFIRDMVQDERSLSITTFIIQLARELGYQTLAEGVETSAQRQQLVALGCDLFQGYLFSKAVPLAECETIIRERAGISD